MLDEYMKALVAAQTLGRISYASLHTDGSFVIEIQADNTCIAIYSHEPANG